MVSNATVNRLVSTSADFDLTGLEIIGYYLRLYAIELILGDEASTAEFMGITTELMKVVEDYKSSVPLTEGSQAESSVYSLIHDQKKAKTYISNFAMSLYNGKLKQIQHGPWDYTLQRGLWCCIDLFSCISRLWEDEDGSLQRRIKYCKLYLTKLAKGELGSTGKQEAEVSSRTPVPEQQTESDSDDEITAMLRRLKAADEQGPEEEEAASSTDLSLPQAPSVRPDRGGREEELEKEPKFIDSEEEEKVLPKASGTRFTQDQLHTMMEKAGQIEQVQKMAKYAISALNYDDIATAKDELRKALQILDSLE